MNFKIKEHAQPVPTGTGHAILLYGVVRDPLEPMHTKFGVPGLGGYPTIQHFIPVLIHASDWGVPHSNIQGFEPWRGCWGALGTSSSGFIGRMDTISSDRHCGSVATAYCRLDVSIRPALKKKSGRAGGAAYRSFRRFLALGGLTVSSPRPNND